MSIGSAYRHESLGSEYEMKVQQNVAKHARVSQWCNITLSREHSEIVDAADESVAAVDKHGYFYVDSIFTFK